MCEVMTNAKDKVPFWEQGYADKTVSCMGGPSIEVYEIAPALRKNARVFEVACGEGRNSLFLAQQGHKVFASDISAKAIEKVRLYANELSVDIEAEVAAIEDVEVPSDIDVFIAQTVLHFFEADVWKEMMAKIIRNTRPGGIHCITNFMDEKDYPLPPEIVAVGHLCKWKVGELVDIYQEEGWELIRNDHYVKWDSHPGIPIHHHSCEKIVARKPAETDDFPDVRVSDLETPDVVPSDDFLDVPLGVGRDAVTERWGEPQEKNGMTIGQRTLGGNNQDAITDNYVLEDMIFGKHGFQFVNGKLTGKYRYFTIPTRVDVAHRG